MIAAQVRAYAAADLPACLALFDGNTPRFFAPEERAGFQADLEAATPASCPYLVLVREGHVLACGGLAIDAEAGRAVLCWGMVDARLHGQGLGRQLTEARLALARSIPGLRAVTLATSQHTQGFYAGFGFAMTQVTPDGFGPGLDRWDMALRW